MRANFIAALRPVGESSTVFEPDYERVNYDASVNVLEVNGNDGDDRFYSDDNSGVTTIDGGAGNDLFQVGQLFGSDRLAPSVASGDEIETVETTRGFLSRGISFAATIYGGDGEDQFAIYSNQAPLSLFGEDGNDTFIVRAFLLASTGDTASGLTTVDGGDGDDYVEYNVNAPVAIDGGEGVDTIVVVGTEGNDQFVIARDAVQGAGLNVSYVSSERIEVDGMEGNDHFYVLSTDARVITSIIGGLGSDTIDVGGDVTGLVQALSIEGTSGAVNHVVSSTDALFDAIFADGIQLAVAGATSGVVIVTPSAGSTTLFEDGGAAAIDSYTLRLAVAAPATATIAYLTVAATQPSSKSEAAGQRTIEVSADGGVTWATSLVLTFDSSIAGTSDPLAWARTQTIYVRAIGDSAAEGESDGDRQPLDHELQRDLRPPADRVRRRARDRQRPGRRDRHPERRRHARRRGLAERHVHARADARPGDRRDRDRHAARGLRAA